SCRPDAIRRNSISAKARSRASTRARTRSAPSPLVGEGWGGGGAVMHQRCLTQSPPPPTPPHKGEGRAPKLRRHCARLSERCDATKQQCCRVTVFVIASRLGHPRA